MMKRKRESGLRDLAFDISRVSLKSAALYSGNCCNIWSTAITELLVQLIQIPYYSGKLLQLKYYCQKTTSTVSLKRAALYSGKLLELK